MARADQTHEVATDGRAYRWRCPHCGRAGRMLDSYGGADAAGERHDRTCAARIEAVTKIIEAARAR